MFLGLFILVVLIFIQLLLGESGCFHLLIIHYFSEISTIFSHLRVDSLFLKYYSVTIVSLPLDQILPFLEKLLHLDLFLFFQFELLFKLFLFVKLCFEGVLSFFGLFFSLETLFFFLLFVFEDGLVFLFLEFLILLLLFLSFF